MRYLFMRFPGGKAKAVTFSYDDGSAYDKRLAEIFDTYGMKCTFNFCNKEFHCCYNAEEMREIFLAKGHEIAVHCAHHRAPGTLRPIEGIREVLDCRLELEEKCGRIIRGMAYPDSGIRVMSNFAEYESIRQYLKDLGIVYARTLGADGKSFDLPTDFYAWMPTAHHKNPELLRYIDEFLALDISPEVYSARRRPRLLYIWGHSHEFERDNNWELIETACEKLAHNDEIWYATNIEIHDYVEAYGRLVYSANGRFVYNPTLIDIYIDVDGTPYTIPSGATVCIEE